MNVTKDIFEQIFVSFTSLIALSRTKEMPVCRPFFCYLIATGRHQGRHHSETASFPKRIRPKAKSAHCRFIGTAQRRHKFILILSLILMANLSVAQIARQSGWVLEDSPMDTSLLYRHAQGKSLMKEKVDLTPYCPSPGDQLGSKSCVGWATSYAAMTILQAVSKKRRGLSFINRSAHSAKFIYNHLLHNSTERALSITRYLREMKKYGVCLERTFPNVTAHQQRPNSAAYQEARRYKVGDYKILFEPGIGMDDARAFYKGRTIEEYKIFITKALLNDSFPVVVGFDTPLAFQHVRMSANQVWRPHLNGQMSVAGEKHAVTVVGYDNRDQSFTLINSYGAQWGYRGFLKIHYDAFARLAVQACVFSIKEKGFKGDADLNFYISSFKLQVPSGDTMSQPAVAIDSSALVYALIDSTALEEQAFQVICDMKVGKLNFSLFNMNLEGKNIVEIPIPNDTIFPDIERFFQMEKGQEEYLILAISNFDLTNKALTDGQTMLNRLKNDEGGAH